MDIYSYINSCDVAQHCREINKVWTPFEMAVLISRSKHQISEKHTAWTELMNEYLDMPTKKIVFLRVTIAFTKSLWN